MRRINCRRSDVGRSDNIRCISFTLLTKKQISYQACVKRWLSISQHVSMRAL
jgi:hypothetical protein